MIWLTFRQFRVQAAVVFGGLAALGAVLAVTGPGISDAYHGGVAACTAQGDCSNFNERFFIDHEMYFGAVVGVVLFLPGIIGIFWGAPLITRELEHGTHRLVWTQSVTRTRWMAVKLGLIGLATVAAAGLASLAAGWWSEPLDQALAERMPRISPLLFDVRGIAPIGYAAFAFMLGVTVGVLVRRLLPAMAVTLIVFTAVQVVMPLWVRPHVIPPERRSVAITSENIEQLNLNAPPGTTDAQMRVSVEAAPGAWTLSNETIDAAGRTVPAIPSSRLGDACMPKGGPGGEPPDGPPQSCFDKIAQLGYEQKVVYQPADRFWPLQWAETGVFAVLTLGLTGFCFS
ncbi:ABC transporter permease [Actinomadura sp. KC345]|uniref:ABC transporter permease n=1 Tax=Actinomadura sp. KC345 TaxID=2530371 RepID=UPI001053E52B|nr:ABC transporter permease [Actinomadura sp. KC345]TDC55451.1 ABC transporter permease [Actinomadura sp. KC345]